jgi:hypothetical protein
MPTNQLQAAWPLKKPQQLVYVELGPDNGGMMLGICEQGLSYRVVVPLIADGPVNFAFALDGKTRLQGVGEIVWSEDGGKTGGLKFTNVSPQFQETVRAWLSDDTAPRNIGREVTPAAAVPLDSLEKIKESVREKSVSIPAPPKQEEQKKQFKPRDWGTPASEPRTPAQQPPETKPVEATQVESKPLEARAAETKSVEPLPGERFTPANFPPFPPMMEPTSAESVVAPPEPEPKPVEIAAIETKPVEQEIVAAKSIQPETAEAKPAERSVADFLLHRAQPKLPEQLRPDSAVALPILRLPFSSPATPEPEPAAPEIPVELAPSVAKVEIAPQVAPNIPEEPKPAAEEIPPQPEGHQPNDEEVATALAAPGLLGLHEPHDFVPPEPSPEEQSSLEYASPRLNRGFAAAIIGLVLAIIFVALALSFRREVGGALIHLGQMLAGEEVKPAAPQPSSAPVSMTPEDSSYPPAAVPLIPANSQPQPEASPKPAANNTLREIGDLPPSNAGANGQKEFEQARSILKGDHRQRDLPIAVSLLWTGVEKGSVSSEVTLADLYMRGDGVEKSCDQARVLLEAAIRKGSPEARRRIELLKQQGCP